MILKDKGRRDYTLTPAILGPTYGVHFNHRDRTSYSFKTVSCAHIASAFNFEIEIKNIILVALRTFEFSHSLGPISDFDVPAQNVANSKYHRPGQFPEMHPFI